MAIRNQCHIEEVVETHQEEGFPQDSANGIHYPAAAMGDFNSVMNQMLQKQAHEMKVVCSQFQEEKNGTIMRLKVEVKNLRRHLRQCETSLASLRKEKQEQTAEIHKLKVVQANLKAEEARLNTVVCKMHKANKELNHELQEKLCSEKREREIQSQKDALLASRHDAEIQKLRKEMKDLEIAAKENQELKQTLAEQRRMQGTCEEQMDKLETELNACNGKIRWLKHRLQNGLEQGEVVKREKQALNDTLMEEREKNEELKVKVQECSACISDLTRERESLQDQIRNLEDTVKRVTQKTAGLEEDLVQVLQQFQGVGRHALGVHAQLIQDLMPRAPDVVRAVSAEGNTVGVDSLQDVSGAWTEAFHSASLPSMSLPGALQVPVENLPDVSTELLMTYLGRISVKWYEFAHALGVGDVAANLQQMEQSPVRKCLQCLEAWIERGPEVDCSWEKLLRVLSVLKLHAVAKEILQELCRRDSSNTL